MEGGSSDDDKDADDDDDDDDDAKGQGDLEDANVGCKRKITTRELAANKGGIKLSLRRVTRRYHAVLVRQRMHFETSQPEHAVAADADGLLPVGVSPEAARHQLDAAYGQMDVPAVALIWRWDRIGSARVEKSPPTA